MQYDAELQFFLKLMHNFRVPSDIVVMPGKFDTSLDLGLRSLLNSKYDLETLNKEFWNYLEQLQDHVLYRIHDNYYCYYLMFRLPDSNTEEKKYLVVGPYTVEEVTMLKILRMAEEYALSSETVTALESYYAKLFCINFESYLLILINSLCEVIWGGIDSFTMQEGENLISVDLEPVAERPDYKESEDALITMKELEERYAYENQLMNSISQGQLHKMEMLFSNNDSGRWMEKRSADPLRNIKNYTIILNTLFRKAAESGSVHPLHIDSLSSKFAKKIEQIISIEDCRLLQKEMARKYCLLVKNHSMKGYSLPIQKVLTRINSDLTADLSLKTQASLLNVNASYLSTLFKKETGCTLTEYVNRKRIEKAIFLLNSSSLQIQTIAQHCGITDVNYFTKTFKKWIGMTPKEYRSSFWPDRGGGI